MKNMRKYLSKLELNISEVVQNTSPGMRFMQMALQTKMFPHF